MVGPLKSQVFTLLERSLDATALRHKTISNNIANAETPEFKRSEVRFEQLLQKELNASGMPRLSGYRTHKGHIPIGSIGAIHVKPQVYTDTSTVYNNNLNNVDIEMEMAQLAENQIYYNTLIQQVNHELRQVRTAIGGH